MCLWEPNRGRHPQCEKYGRPAAQARLPPATQPDHGAGLPCAGWLLFPLQTSRKVDRQTAPSRNTELLPSVNRDWVGILLPPAPRLPCPILPPPSHLQWLFCFHPGIARISGFQAWTTAGVCCLRSSRSLCQLPRAAHNCHRPRALEVF